MGQNRLFWRLFWSFVLICGPSVAVIAIGAEFWSPGTLKLAAGAAVVLGSILAIFLIGRSLSPLQQLSLRLQQLGLDPGAHAELDTDFQDFTELAGAFHGMQRRLADRATQAEVSAQRLATVLGSMREGVLAVDRNERVIFANQACRELFEAGKRELEGRPLLEATRQLAIRDAIVKSFDDDAKGEVEFPSSDSSRRFISLRASRLPGQPCPGVVAVLQDVTELRRLESLRREFATNVSHELKTPLASIKAYAETLRLGALHDHEHNVSFLLRIEEQADRLHSLILDLLHLSRVETGKESFDLKDLSLQDVLARCAAVHAEAANSKGVQLRVDSQPDLIVRADHDGLTTIFDNLIRNAINHTPPGGSIRLRWHPHVGSAVVDVQDTGIGIAAIHHDRIFERFYRVDRARSRELGGTGLGLAIVKHLAQAFGGDVSLQSEPGKGSTFSVRLPLGTGSD